MVKEIQNDIFYVGVQHPELENFDELYPTRNGTTYNSYIVRGAKKTVLVDTVEEAFAGQFLDNVRRVLPLEELDMVVVNHTEHDHSGAMAALLGANPRIQVVCTRSAENFLKKMLNRSIDVDIVAKEKAIDIGGKTLQFFPQPFLHWPDTMMTYMVEQSILFSGDAFGSHYCSEGLFDDEAGDFSEDFRIYFDTIIRPFKKNVRDAMARLKGLDIKVICPTHGPVWRSEIGRALVSYREWSAEPFLSGKKRVLMLTHSPHGTTRRMAEEISKALAVKGIETVEFKALDLDEAKFRNELERCDALVVGAATVNRDAGPPLWKALALLSTVTPRSRVGAVFGAFGWSGEAVEMIETRLKGLQYQLPVEGLKWRFNPTEDEQKACYEFGTKLAEALLSQSDENKSKKD